MLLQIWGKAGVEVWGNNVLPPRPCVGPTLTKTLSGSNTHLASAECLPLNRDYMSYGLLLDTSRDYDISMSS